jgi:predicted lipase
MILDFLDLAVLCETVYTYDGNGPIVIPHGVVKCLQWFDKDGVQVGVFSHDDATIICFRGTDETVDWWSNLNWNLVPLLHENDVKVHQGFLRDVMPLYERLLVAVMHEPGPLIITGHSRGGALATIMAHLVVKPSILVTFGCPVVGNEAFARGNSNTVYRVCMENDPVPRLVVPHYKHVGIALRIGRPATGCWWCRRSRHPHAIRTYIAALSALPRKK